MRSKILVLTHTKDGIHSDVVVRKLQERGASVFRLNTDTLSGGDSLVTFVADDRITFEFVDQFSGTSITSDQIGCVWYRRPNNLKIKVSDPAQRKQGESDAKAFLDGLWLILTDAFWMSRLPQIESARRKILQLSLAKEIGFLVPKTLVTNDPTKVHEVFGSRQQPVIFKCLGESYIENGEEFMIPTTLLTENHWTHIEAVKIVPSLFQAFVDKNYDVRVTVVGKKVFAVKIDSQADPLTQVDWRHPEKIATLNYSPIILPSEISEKCVTLVTKLGLVFGAIDFAVDKKGNYLFLEINPNGQWYWLEHFAGHLISDAIVDMLIAGK